MTANPTEKEKQEPAEGAKGMRFHWQNLSTIHGRCGEPTRERFPLHGRCWLYIRSFMLQFEWSIVSKSFGLSLETYEDLTLGMAIPPISIYISVKKPECIKEHWSIASVKIFDWSLWWEFWTDNIGWSSKTPRWRHGCFHILDFFLGKQEYTTVTIEEREVFVPMPEGTYLAQAKLFESTWKRPRWFPKRIMRVDLKIDKGIPHAGKGENSWDCGDDATYGMCCAVKNIAEGVGVLVGSVLHDRVKYGGYGDWLWCRQEPPKYGAK